MASQFQKRGCGLLPTRHLMLRNLFVDLYGTDKWAGSRRRNADTDVFFGLIIDDYRDWCEWHEKQYGINWLREQDSRVPAADREFVKLVREFYVAANHNADLAGWPARKIAESILSYMEEYYTINWQNGSTIEEDMLDCLLNTDGECQQSEKAIPA